MMLWTENIYFLFDLQMLESFDDFPCVNWGEGGSNTFHRLQKYSCTLYLNLF